MRLYGSWQSPAENGCDVPFVKLTLIGRTPWSAADAHVGLLLVFVNAEGTRRSVLRKTLLTTAHPWSKFNHVVS